MNATNRTAGAERTGFIYGRLSNRAVTPQEDHLLQDGIGTEPADHPNRSFWASRSKHARL